MPPPPPLPALPDNRHVSSAAARCDLLPGGDGRPVHAGGAAAGGAAVAVQQRRRVPGGRQGDQPQVAGADIRHRSAAALPVHTGTTPGERTSSSRGVPLRPRCSPVSRLLKGFWQCSCPLLRGTSYRATTELFFFFNSPLPWQKEERTMLEDTKAALLDLDKVTVFFRQLEDECLVASKRLHHERLTLPIHHPPPPAANEQLYGSTNSE